MHILVTDRLACPRCGPDFGLILLADDLQSRRVLRGALACSNCRSQYPVEGGFVDLRPTPSDRTKAQAMIASEDPEAALKVAALLGVEEGPGLLGLVGPSAGHALRLSRMIEGIEVLAVHPELRADPEQDGVSRLAVGTSLPLLTGSLRGVVLEGASGTALLAEAVRVLGPGSRLVYLRPPEGMAAEMRQRGLDLLMEAETTLVGVRK